MHKASRAPPFWLDSISNIAPPSQTSSSPESGEIIRAEVDLTNPPLHNMSVCEVEEASSTATELSRSFRAIDGLKTYLEAETGRKQTESVSMPSLSPPESRLLILPYELRQRIFEYVFLKEMSENFPPQKSLCATSMLGLIVRVLHQPGFLCSNG